MVAVVTGASAGVGRAVVRELARRGADVGLLARGTDGLTGARHEVERLGARAIVAPTDVSDEAQVERAADLVERELGPIDIWINDAMVSVFSPIDQLTEDEIRRVTEVTYLGTVWGTLAALRRMKRRNRGVIVQVGSALAYRAIPLQGPYCAAKHAVKGFTQSLRTELLHERSNVQVSMVDLPALNTPQFDWTRSRMPRRAQPVPPIFQPEVAARAIVDTAFAPRRRRIVAWPTLKAVFAERIAPGIADRWLARTGVDAQMTDEPAPVNHPDNLFTPLDGDRGAHGRFDGRAKERTLLGPALAASFSLVAFLGASLLVRQLAR
jgi:NAD(P)-dependent dehydrogenase (short-subunit alcohol dehydrogenase family)